MREIDNAGSSEDLVDFVRADNALAQLRQRLSRFLLDLWQILGELSSHLVRNEADKRRPRRHGREQRLRDQSLVCASGVPCRIAQDLENGASIRTEHRQTQAGNARDFLRRH